MSTQIQERLNGLVDVVKERLNYEKTGVKFFIAGGSVFSSLNNSTYNDIDVYLYNSKDLKKVRQGSIDVTSPCETIRNYILEQTEEKW